MVNGRGKEEERKKKRKKRTVATTHLLPHPLHQGAAGDMRFTGGRAVDRLHVGKKEKG